MSGLSLKKGGNLSLTKEAAKTGKSLTSVIVGLGWDVNAMDGAEFDADVSAFILTAAGKVRSDADFCFYNQLEVDGGNVQHMGDNRTGAGEGDDEQILMALDKISPEITRISIVVTIDEAEERGQNFGQLENCFIRVVDAETGTELGRYDLTEDYSTEIAMIFGEIYLKNGEWKFKAVGAGRQDGLGGIARNYGVNI